MIVTVKTDRCLILIFISRVIINHSVAVIVNPVAYLNCTGMYGRVSVITVLPPADTITISVLIQALHLHIPALCCILLGDTVARLPDPCKDIKLYPRRDQIYLSKC